VLKAPLALLTLVVALTPLSVVLMDFLAQGFQLSFSWLTEPMLVLLHHFWLTVCFLVALAPLMVLLLAHLQTFKLLFLTEAAQLLVRPILSL
jgi:hypothetical protein